MLNILKRFFSRNLEDNGKGNVVNNQDFPDCQFKFYGDNNRLIISPFTKLKGYIFIHGDHNVVQIGRNSFLKGEFEIGQPHSSCVGPTQKCNLKIGENVYMGKSSVIIADDETNVSIGNNCAFGSGLQILASDMHSVTDEKGNLLNKASFIYIGNHVWLGVNCTVLKDSFIAENSIVAAGSTVNHVFREHNALIAGNPGKIVRHGVNWNKLSPNLYAQRQKE